MRAINQKTKIIDARHLILGRMASIIAKRLLEGDKIVVVNAEKTVISGKRKSRTKVTKEFLGVGHPKRGPFHYRRPDRVVRRTVRGMLPYKKPKGKRAYKRLKVFIGLPEKLEDREMETLAKARMEKLKCPYFTVGELAKEIGWNYGE